MKLFAYEGYQVTISPEALLLKPFKKIWDRDRTKYKQRSLMELGYIYFMEDSRSDYQYLVDIEEREKAVREGEGIPDSWKPDVVVQDALDFYASFKSAAALLLEDTRMAVNKLRILLRELDLTKSDDKGKPIYTLNTITATIKQIPELIKGLNEAEKSLIKEDMGGGRMKGSGEKTLMEDTLDL